MKVIAYLRVSTDEQAQSGLGLEAQEYSINDYAKKINSNVAEIFKDEGFSGTLPMSKRPGLNSAIQSLKKGDILLVAKRDRLSRDVKILMLIEDELKKRKARLLSAAGEGTEADDSSSILFRGMIDQFSQFERLRIGERTKAALQAKKKKGERVGYIPFGYQLGKCCTNEKEKHLEENSKEQNILQQMKKLNTNGFSIRAIAKELNQQRILNRNNNLWNNGSIFRVMKNIK